MSSIRDFSLQNWQKMCIDDIVTQYDSLSLSSSETDNITLDSGIYFDSKSDLLKPAISSNLTLKELPPPPPPPPPYNSTHNIISSIIDTIDLNIPFQSEDNDISATDNNSNFHQCSPNRHLENQLSSSNNQFSLSKFLTEEQKQSKALFEVSRINESPVYEGNIRHKETINHTKSNLSIHEPPNCIYQDSPFAGQIGKQLYETQNASTSFDYRKEDIKILGSCNKCQCLVTDSESACLALGNLYHSNCFTCCYCSRSLRGKVFYKDQEKIYCENDYMVFGFHKSVKICNACGHIITETILEALGKDFHPRCFKCSICQKCLDGIPFTIDRNNNIYCILDYHNTFAPRCAVCLQPIIPCKDSDDVVRVVVNDRDFHVECYRCQTCLRLLSNESNCFVWTTDRSETNIKLLCRKCYVSQIRDLSRLKQH